MLDGRGRDDSSVPSLLWYSHLLALLVALQDDDSDAEITAAEEKRRKEASAAAKKWKAKELKAVKVEADPLESGWLFEIYIQKQLLYNNDEILTEDEYNKFIEKQ